jgi:protocadherin-16/23
LLFINKLLFFSPFPQILQVTAVDFDTGNNARLTYRIVSGDEILQHQQNIKNFKGNNGTRSTTAAAMTFSRGDDIKELFGIFPNSGWLYLRGTLDRETRDRYEITVLASDNGTPTATALTRIVVNVLDANDNDPKFSRSLYEFSVEENLRRGALVGVLSASDMDLDVNAAIRFSLIPSNTSFQVNPLSGEFQ